jgi:hypothetical protein
MGWTETKICTLDVEAEYFRESSVNLPDGKAEYSESQIGNDPPSANPERRISKMDTNFQVLVFLWFFIFGRDGRQE